MKARIHIALLGLVLMGCNMNPNKEQRIQTLEIELQETKDRLDKVEKTIENLDIQHPEKKVVEME